ncbi:sugar O-acetyltransferase [Saccharothrix syringae]|uniref:Sugar O-acetyltransferase n=2 Tax=Saccharothrix syringae TaxID=103733 RepID=A0A5Q0HES6_SACSY|nr:sugar O-acetyltransferase [Saccharothrix syringae]
MRERMLAGDLFRGDDPELLEDAARADDLVRAYNDTSARQAALRRRLLADLFGEVGEDVVVLPPLRVDFGRNTRVGPRTFANTGLVVLDVAPVAIGADVLMGPNVQLITSTHPVDPAGRRAKWVRGAPVVVGENVWLGGGVIVLPGVSIGADTVVGAGAVVTRDLPAGVVAVGNPARVIRRVDS